MFCFKRKKEEGGLSTFVGVICVRRRGRALLFLGITEVLLLVLFLFLVPFPRPHCYTQRVSLTSSESRQKSPKKIRTLRGKTGIPRRENTRERKKKENWDIEKLRRQKRGKLGRRGLNLDDEELGEICEKGWVVLVDGRGC